jgi:hypothetical protein
MSKKVTGDAGTGGRNGEAKNNQSLPKVTGRRFSRYGEAGTKPTKSAKVAREGRSATAAT